MAVADRTRATVPKELLDSVVAAFDPLQVILYGSHARGEATADSDWDLLVVVDDTTPPEKLSLRAGFEAARSFPMAADVVPCRRSWFEARRGVINSLAWVAATEGQVVYDRGRG